MSTPHSQLYFWNKHNYSTLFAQIVSWTVILLCKMGCFALITHFLKWNWVSTWVSTSLGFILFHFRKSSERAGFAHSQPDVTLFYRPVSVPCPYLNVPFALNFAPICVPGPILPLFSNFFINIRRYIQLCWGLRPQTPTKGGFHPPLESPYIAPSTLILLFNYELLKKFDKTMCWGASPPKPPTTL